MNFTATSKLAFSEPGKMQTATYRLSLTLYCIYWTYYGLISTGGRFGWNYLLVLLAPLAAVFIFSPVLTRVAYVAKRENVSSIADLLSNRYGNSQAVGFAATAITFVGTVPLIAQQLKFLTIAFLGIEGGSISPTLATFFLALCMIPFVIFMNARRPAIAERNESLLKLIALDAVVKFVVISAISVTCVIYLMPFASTVREGIAAGVLVQPLRPDGGFFVTLFLLTVSTLCMPHLFYVGISNAEHPQSIRNARWFLLAYFAVLSVLTVPIFVAGRYLFQSAVDPEMYVIRLTTEFWGKAGASIVYLSSVWTGALLIAITSAALSGMVSQQFYHTKFMRAHHRTEAAVNIGRDVMNLRRVAIAVIILLGFLCSVPIERVFLVGNLGISYTSILVQLLPCLIGAAIWRRGHRNGVLAGLAAGSSLWLILIAIPLLSGGAVAPLIPSLRLAFYTASNGFVQSFFLSLVVNTSLYVGVSLLSRQRLVDRLQAVTFIESEVIQSLPTRNIKRADINVSVGDVKTLVAQFVGQQDAATAFEELEREGGESFHDGDRASPSLIQAAERILAGVVGAPLAHSVIVWQLGNHEGKSSEIVRFLDEAAQAVKHNREMLHATLNNLSQGVCVVDRESRFLAWNSRYMELFGHTPGAIRVGSLLADVIRANRGNSGYSAGDTDEYISRRLHDVRHGIPHILERVSSTGKVLRVMGLPMTDGRYITSFTDITSVQDVVADLRRANEKLEERVNLRTMELTQVNKALQDSTERAEMARASQARFLAAASHDLLQPLHAARLFLGALLERAGDNISAELLKNTDTSIESANRLLSALLNLSRLEVGGVRPEIHPVDVGSLLQELNREFKPVADAKALRLRIVPTKYCVTSDPDLLRSVLQNLIGNALRYTHEGAILVICRRTKSGLRFEVRDTGQGIPEDALTKIFKEYVRLPNGKTTSGSGLGLFIVERICKVLNYPLTVRSSVGKGSIFTITVPFADSVPREPQAAPSVTLLSGLTVLCVEHDPAILKSLDVLLSRWGIELTVAKSVNEALTLEGQWDVLLSDYHFDSGPDGLDLIERLAGRASALALITADSSEEVMVRAANLKAEVIRKPLAPAVLRGFLSRVWLLKTEKN